MVKEIAKAIGQVTLAYAGMFLVFGLGYKAGLTEGQTSPRSELYQRGFDKGFKAGWDGATEVAEAEYDELYAFAYKDGYGTAQNGKESKF